jgi:hypothetical protein
LNGSFTNLQLGTSGNAGDLLLGTSSVSIAGLTMDESIIDGTGTVTLTGSATVSGNFQGGGTIHNLGTLTATASSYSFYLQGGEVLVNDGTINLFGEGIGSDGNSGDII